MDVGYFISELLGQHGDVSVPGLGYFAHTRVNGYYNDKEGAFYPPSYNVQFDPQFIEDDTLAQHIANNKNISLASSRYFTEKYVTNIKTLATTGEVAIADLGWLYMQGMQLLFRSNSEVNAGPEFFGFPVIKANKIGHQQPVLQEEASYATSYTSNAAVEPEPAEQVFETDSEHEAYLTDLTEKRRKKSLYVFLVLAVLFTGLIYFLYTKYDKSVFDLNKPDAKAEKDTLAKPKKIVVVKDTTAKTDAAADTVTIVKLNEGVKKYVAKHDTVAPKKVNIPVNEIPLQPRYEIMGGSFKDKKEAQAAILNYRSINVESHVVDDAPGKRVKLSLGTFKSREEAEAARKTMIRTKKVGKDIYTLEIKPKL